MLLYYLIAGLMTFVGMYVNKRLQAKFKQYGQIANRHRKSGAEIAKEMLRDFGINDVQIMVAKGKIGDHYNPLNKTISLSPGVFQGRSIIAAAVAAHECGHAVQHAEAYRFLKFRSAIVPLVKAAAGLQQFGLLAALMFIGSFPQLMLIVLISFIITTTFSLATLPVEFDASDRALHWLEDSGNTSDSDHEAAQEALKWAAMTYVAAALSSLAMLAFVALTYLGNRD